MATTQLSFNPMTPLTRTRLVGGTGGHPFGNHVLPDGARLTGIYVHTGDFVDGLQLEYASRKLKTRVLMPFIGGVGGGRRAFRLKNRERIVAISGRYDRQINCLRFHTNLRRSPVYGREKGKRFFLRIHRNEEFRGLYGRSGWFLDSIGMINGPAAFPVTTLPAPTPRRVHRAISDVVDKIATEWIDPILEVPRVSI